MPMFLREIQLFPAQSRKICAWLKEAATDEEIIEALKVSCAWDFVEKLPDTINSNCRRKRAADFQKDRPSVLPLQELF